jgi:hypothetical protein
MTPRFSSRERLSYCHPVGAYRSQRTTRVEVLPFCGLLNLLGQKAEANHIRCYLPLCHHKTTLIAFLRSFPAKNSLNKSKAGIHLSQREDTGEDSYHLTTVETRISILKTHRLYSIPSSHISLVVTFVQLRYKRSGKKLIAL